MGGQRKKQTAAIKQSNKLAERSLKQQAAAAREANRIAVRTANEARAQSAQQNAALIAAEQQSAELLSKVGQKTEIRTEVIDDEEAARKKLMSMSGRNAYGFSRPSGGGLGGGMSQLG